MRILITGGAGFVGHHFVEHFLRKTDADIVVLDKLSYASNGWERLRDISAYDDERVLSLAHDFSKALPIGIRQEIGDVDYIFHIGAESHVDNSITDPAPFVESNVVGTMHMLDYARSFTNKLKCFFYFSTDEVFGPAQDGFEYSEEDRHNPSNPYAATKSGGEMLVKAYRNTYKLPAIITRSMNIFGERQHPEKFIPLCIAAALNGEKVLIHGYPDKDRAGSRFYIHARNVADGYLHLVNKIEENPLEVVGQDFHITGEKEVDNLHLYQLITAMVKEKTGCGDIRNFKLVDFHSARPGHDLRYALSGAKMKTYGWEPPKAFEQSLEKTVDWTLQNKDWLDV